MGGRDPPDNSPQTIEKKQPKKAEIRSTSVKKDRKVVDDEYLKYASFLDQKKPRKNKSVKKDEENNQNIITENN